MPESIPTQAFVRTKPAHIHPRLLDKLKVEEFFPMTVTFQTSDMERTPTGDVARPGDWTDVAGLVDIPCRRGLPVTTERRSTWGRVDIDNYELILDGYYPQIDGGMRAVMADGVTIDVRGARHDSGMDVTVVLGRDLEPGAEGLE